MAIANSIRPVFTGTEAKPAENLKPRTMRIKHPSGPFVVDVWEARHPAGVAPVVLVHGWGGSGSYWRRTARELSETATVYVPDLPGTGRSQPVRKTQNMYDQVAALGDLLDVFKLDKVQLVGHSMGSAMSILLADARPGQVERLIITSMCFFVTEDQVEVYHSIMKFIRLTMRFRSPWMVAIPGLKRMLAARYFYRIPNDPEALRQGLEDYLTLDFDTAAACADNAADSSIPEAGARLQMPTLLIACHQDQVMPVENVDYTVETIPQCAVRWMDHCGHLPMVEKPDEYMTIIREFLHL